MMSPVIRRATKADVSSVVMLAATSSTAAHWTNEVYDSYCSVALRENGLQKAIFIAGLSTAASTRPGEFSVVGFAAFIAIDTADECELENMVVAESWRRQGIGARLLNAGLLWCRAWCPSAVAVRQAQIGADSAGVRLEVRASNHAAIEFYEQAGFAVVGHRTAYYSQPEEDAILMRKPMGDSYRNMAIL